MADSPTKFCHGIRLVCDWPETSDVFFTSVGAALDLIARSDPMRFERVRATIRTIGSVPVAPGTDYLWPLRLCSVNIRFFATPGEDDPQLSVAILASALVRDATIGHLLDQGILRTRRNWQRFDAVCCRQAQLFLHRLGMARTPWDADLLQDLALGEYLSYALQQLKSVPVVTGRFKMDHQGSK
ncbi:MAG: hypothetical protein ACP5MD_11795 [Verrucomicrobiia bacterium]